MKKQHNHYSTEYPEVNLKIYTISESLRQNLYIFKTTTGIFSYRKIDLGTKVFIEHLKIPENSKKMLDLGCGYGPIGIVLAKEAPQSDLYFIDVNRRAIWAVKENVKINIHESLKNIKILSGDYFRALKGEKIKFDGIYMNPPIRKGRNEFLDIINQIPSYLVEMGCFQFVIRKKMGAPYIEKYINKKYPRSNLEIICKRSGYWVFNWQPDEF